MDEVESHLLARLVGERIWSISPTGIRFMQVGGPTLNAGCKDDATYLNYCLANLQRTCLHCG